MNELRRCPPGVDYLTWLGFVRRGDVKVCVHCDREFPRADGALMRSHRRRCPIEAWDPYTPAGCDA